MFDRFYSHIVRPRLFEFRRGMYFMASSVAPGSNLWRGYFEADRGTRSDFGGKKLELKIPSASGLDFRPYAAVTFST